MAGQVDSVGWGGNRVNPNTNMEDDEFDSLAMETARPTPVRSGSSAVTGLQSSHSRSMSRSQAQSQRAPMGRGRPIPVNNDASMPDLNNLPPPPSAGDDLLASFANRGAGAQAAQRGANTAARPSSFPPQQSYRNSQQNNMNNSMMSRQQGAGVPSWGWPFTPNREIPKVNRERRCYIITIITFIFICFALALGIILGLSKREQRVRGDAGSTNSAKGVSGPCCARQNSQFCDPGFKLISGCSNPTGCPVTCGGVWLTNPQESTQCCSAANDMTCDPEYATCTKETCGNNAVCGSNVNALWIFAPKNPTAPVASTCCSTDGFTCIQNVANPQCNTNQAICQQQCFGNLINGSQNSAKPCCNVGNSGTCSGNFCDLSQQSCQSCQGQYGPWSPYTAPVVQQQPTGTCSCPTGVNGMCTNVQGGMSCDSSQQACAQCGGQFQPFGQTPGQKMCCSMDGQSCNAALNAQCNQLQATCNSQTCQGGIFITAPFDASRVDITTPRYQQLAQLVGPALLFSNATLLLDPETAQARSLHWVANLDPVQVRSADTTNLNARFALASLYYSTEGQFWSNSVGWLSSASHCNWFGVSCDTITNNPNNPGNVVSLDLENNNLRGNMPEELFSGLGGTIVDLELHNNKLNGTIPANTLSNMIALQTFSLYNNTISGAIPTSIGNLPNLRRIYFENNLLTNRIPETIGKLTQLERLDVFNNRLYGSVPAEFGSLVKLQRLWLSNNSFWGNLPTQLGNMVALQELYLDENLFNGILPDTLGNLNNLRDFRCYTNNFQGNVPSSLGQLINLQIMYLDNNRFGGSIPQTFGNLFNLKELSLFNNTLQGQIPPALGSLSNLQVMSLSFNNLSGPIPSTFNQLASMRVMHLYQNQLQGGVPNLTGLTNLRDLFLYSNQLDGNLPNFLGQMNTLDDVNLSSNNFVGQIPDGISSPSMRSLLLNGNPGVTGAIPQSVCNHKSNGQLKTLVVDCQITGCYTSCT